MNWKPFISFVSGCKAHDLENVIIPEKCVYFAEVATKSFKLSLFCNRNDVNKKLDGCCSCEIRLLMSIEIYNKKNGTSRSPLRTDVTD